MTVSDKIMSLKRKKYAEQNGVCAGCGKKFKDGDAIDLAHIVPQRKWCKAKWGECAIQHERNMVLTHHGNCNDAVQINPGSIQAKLLMESIRNELDNK